MSGILAIINFVFKSDVKYIHETMFLFCQAAYRFRSRSTPRGNVYIPQPDYRSYDPISVDISQNSSRYGGIHSSNAPVATGPKYDRCPQRYSVSC